MADEAAGPEETFSASLMDAILTGDGPARVYRRHRKLIQATLAAMAGISVPYLIQIEAGKRVPSPDVLKKLA